MVFGKAIARSCKVACGGCKEDMVAGVEALQEEEWIGLLFAGCFGLIMLCRMGIRASSNSGGWMRRAGSMVYQVKTLSMISKYEYSKFDQHNW